MSVNAPLWALGALRRPIEGVDKIRGQSEAVAADKLCVLKSDFESSHLGVLKLKLKTVESYL